MKKKFVPILAAGALIVVIICFMLLGSIIEKYTPSKEHMNLSDYYNLSGEQDVALILDNQILDAKGKLLNGTVYLDYETVCSYLNDRFYWDHNENKLLYTTATDLISADADSTSYYVTKDSHSLDHPIVKADAQTAYIAIDFLKLYSDFSYEVLDSPNRVILTTAWGDGCNDRVSLFLGDLALSNQLLVALLDLCQAVLSPLLLDVAQSNGVALNLCKCLCDALTHSASADNTDLHRKSLL